MIAFTQARMHLAVELGGAGRHPGAAHRSGVDPAVLRDPSWTFGLVSTAAARGLDLAVLAEPSGAVALATRIAPLVPSIGLVPQAALGDVDPRLLADALTTLNALSSGRVGWEPVVSPGARWHDAPPVIRAVASAGHPLTVIRADDPEALDVAARSADVVRIAAPGLDAACALRDRVRAAAAAAGRRPDDLVVLLDAEVHLADDAAAARTSLERLDAEAGVLPPSTVRIVGSAVELANVVERAVALRAADGITFLPLVLPTDLRAITGEVVPLLAGRGLLRTGRGGAGLRTRFGLAQRPDRLARRVIPRRVRAGIPVAARDAS